MDPFLMLRTQTQYGVSIFWIIECNPFHRTRKNIHPNKYTRHYRVSPRYNDASLRLKVKHLRDSNITPSIGTREPENKTPRFNGASFLSGEDGIRTREPLWVTHLPSVRAKPDYAES